MDGGRTPGDAASDRPIGRTEVTEAIERCLSEASVGTASGLLVTGGGGTGKSHFLRRAVARARERGFLVALGRALPDELPAPFSLVRQLISSVGTEEGASAESGTADGTALSPLFVPWEGIPARERAAGPGPPSSQRPSDALERILAPMGRTAVEGLGASRHRLYERLVRHFVDLASTEPLLIAIDDLHLADRSSLAFLERLCSSVAGSRIALIATVGEGPDLPEEARAPIAAIGRAPGVLSVAVRTMTIPEIADFATVLLDGARPSESDVQRWHAETGGNPLFVEQMVRATLGLGSLAPLPAGRARGTEDLVAVLHARIRSLDDAERRVLAYSAVLGREFDFDRLRTVVGVEEERLTEALDRLVLAGLLRERGDEVYEFVSEAVRASVYADLTETRRRILHRKVARALESRGGAGEFELARQFYLGRDDPKTVDYNLRAAETATRSFAFEAALSHLTRALEAARRLAPRDPRLEVRLLTEEGRLLHEIGEFLRSEETLSEAVRYARELPKSGPELGRALVALAWTRVDRSDYPSAEALATEATGLLERFGNPRDLLSTHRVLGTVYWRMADFPRAELHQRAALEIAEREGTALEQGHALVDVANTLTRRLEQFDAGIVLYGRAAELFATADDPSSRARVMMNRAVLEYMGGRTLEAFRDIRVAIRDAERSRSPLWIGYCFLNLAQWQAEGGDVPSARSSLDGAIRAVGAIGDGLLNQQIAMTRGMISEAGGAFDEAEHDFQEALDLSRAMGLRSEASEVLFRLAGLSSRRGDRVLARGRLDEARSNGLLDHRPDFAPRVTALESTIGQDR